MKFAASKKRRTGNVDVASLQAKLEAAKVKIAASEAESNAKIAKMKEELQAQLEAKVEVLKEEFQVKLEASIAKVKGVPMEVALPYMSRIMFYDALFY